MKWTTRDFRHLSLGEMTCEHLRACLNKILRERWRMGWADRILAELERRCTSKPKDKVRERETA